MSESIISNHPFIDGNKRNAYVLMRIILLGNKIKIHASQSGKFDFVIRGESSFDEIKSWMIRNISPE